MVKRKKAAHENIALVTDDTMPDRLMKTLEPIVRSR